nr:CirpA2 protein [Rhipicephalus pulchellus]
MLKSTVMYFPVIVALVVCALLAAPAKSEDQETDFSSTDGAELIAKEPEVYPIDQFMNNTEIWVFNTTQPDPPNCKKDKSKSMTQTATSFVRSHVKNGNIIEENLVGNFTYFNDKEKVYDGIYISGESSGVYAEHLYYVSEDKKCGLVQVFAKDQNVWTELRVRGHPNYGSLDAECRREYEAYVKEIKGKKNSTSPYSDDCQIKV